MKKKNIIIIAGVVVLAIGGFFLYSNYQKAQAAAKSTFETTAAANGDLTAIVGATGTVRSNQSTYLSWTTTGAIQNLNAKLGDTVKRGVPLANLDPITLGQNIILAEGNLITAQKNLDDLKNSTTARSIAQQNLANAEKALNDAKDRVKSKQYQRASQTTIDLYRAQLIVAEDALQTASDNYNKVKHVPESNVIYAYALTALTDAQIKRDQAQANLNYVSGLPDTVEVSISQSNLAVAQSKYDDALREWNRLKDGPDPQEIATAEAQVNSIKATLASAFLASPFDGTVTEVSSLVGDQVIPGTATYRIDDLSHILVDVQVPEVDINKVKIGQDVTLTFDAILTQSYQGKVTIVGRVGNVVAGVVNFTVTMEITNPDDQVKPGMTSAVNIITSQIKDILLVPNRAIRQVNTNRVVYILKNGQATPVVVELGATSDTQSQIVKGDLKVGDLIILNPPSSLLQAPSGGPVMRLGGG
jgi:HlyD family secretion protein